MARNLKPGTRQIHPLIDTDLYERLKEAASGYNMTFAQLIRAYIEYGLKHLDLTFQPKKAG